MWKKSTKVTYTKKRKSGVTLKKVAKQVKHLVKLEQNALCQDQMDVASTAIVNGGTISYLVPTVPLTLVDNPAGLSTTGQTSYKCVFTKFQIYIRLTSVGQITAQVAQNNPIVRIIIFQDWANQGALPTVSQVLGAAIIEGAQAQLNNKRFTIKYDKTHQIKLGDAYPVGLAGTVFGNNGAIVEVRKTIKLARNKTIEYVAAGSAVADAQKGQLFLLMITDSLSQTSNVSATSYSAKFNLHYEAL